MSGFSTDMGSFVEPDETHVLLDTDLEESEFQPRIASAGPPLRRRGRARWGRKRDADEAPKVDENQLDAMRQEFEKSEADVPADLAAWVYQMKTGAYRNVTDEWGRRCKK